MTQYSTVQWITQQKPGGVLQVPHNYLGNKQLSKQRSCTVTIEKDMYKCMQGCVAVPVTSVYRIWAGNMAMPCTVPDHLLKWSLLARLTSMSDAQMFNIHWWDCTWIALTQDSQHWKMSYPKINRGEGSAPTHSGPAVSPQTGGLKRWSQGTIHALIDTHSYSYSHTHAHTCPNKTECESASRADTHADWQEWIHMPNIA